MAQIRKDHRVMLRALLDAAPESSQHYSQLAPYEKKMCMDWILSAPNELLRESRVHRLARSLRWGRFQPFYDLGLLTFSELNELYGTPHLLKHLPSEQQTLALNEQRVLAANHFRNYDASDVLFGIASPEDKLNDGIILAYARPCHLDAATVSWLNCNGWETTRELEGLFHPAPPAPSRLPARPLRLEPLPAQFPFPVSHSSAVWHIAANWDWQRAVSASADGTLLLWNPATGAPLARLAGHKDAVWTVALTPDGQRAVSASWDRTLRVWDLATGKTVAVLEGHTDEIYAVAITPDGKRAVSGGRDETVRVWDLDTGLQLQVLRGHLLEIWAVAITPDGTRALSASGDRTLRVWDLATGETIRVLKGHSGTVERVVTTADGVRAVSGSIDRTLRVWDLATGETLHVLEGHTWGVLSVALTPDQKHVISSSTDSTVRVWDLDTGTQLRVMDDHTAPLWGLALTGDGQRIVTAGREGDVHVWDLETGRDLATLSTGAEYHCCRVSPDGTTIVAGDHAGEVRFIRIAGSRPPAS